ncbi:MAG: hypothetical protein KAU20_03345 [Nanoarchaeota archaeon]|nr:hypothetical protein [Nanoarchaeota archaeon]
MGGIDFFNSIEYLEPRCPKCNIVIEYDVTTKFDERKGSHICLSCGCVLK